MKPIICITGPTASGKSAWAVEIAKSVGGEIINADAMQVYKDLQILSARPLPSDMQGIPHHLFGHISGHVRYSTGAWLAEVQPVILDCLARDVVPILTGGTGLYFKALIDGMAQIPAISSCAMSSAQELLDVQGIDALRRKAETVDAIATKRVLGHDPQRLLRIVSVYEETGRGLSDWQSDTRPVIPKQFCRLAVVLPERQALYARINSRFEAMINNGGLEEAKAVFQAGYDESLPMMKAIGLQQFFPYLKGEASLEQAIDIAKRDTRRFAKRQFTWFRGQAKEWTSVNNHSQKKEFEANIPLEIL
ncbi:tRNA (adenosine(37)-N6)-dimethylallyltransferase MiaA [Hellea balneolensis]|uniref:tRNA (adenosine(37)-N6)-dimethylallyltransferase MiaA n=1 Tax=Hellea balneolensis TaxID=287478 RepID=UPI0004160CA0|nr:tRNA (adenosine(37)-N6)-dimethylallyltransferase MiaA [Hellea balneolensis]